MKIEYCLKTMNVPPIMFEMRQRFVAHNFYKVDGKCADRVVDLIEEMIECKKNQ